MMIVIVVVGGCGPAIGVASDETTTTEADGTTTTTTGVGTTATDSIGDGVGDYDVAEAPDVGGTTGLCPPDAQGLQVMWEVVDEANERGGSIAPTSTGAVWTASTFDETTLHAVDGQGEALWSVMTGVSGGEADLVLHDVVEDSDGRIVLVGTVFDIDGSWISTRWYAADGAAIEENAFGFGGFAEAAGVAADDAGRVVVTGRIADEVAVRYYGSVAVADWDQSFSLESGSDTGIAVAIDATGAVLVVGHDNFQGGTIIVLKYSPNGELLWSISEPEQGSSVSATSIAVDSTGRPVVSAWLEVTGFVRRYSGDGMVEVTTPIDYWPNGIAIDAADRIVLAGNRPLTQNTLVFERRDIDGSLLEHSERVGRWALDVATDGDCHVLVAGDIGAAWATKLQ